MFCPNSTVEFMAGGKYPCPSTSMNGFILSFLRVVPEILHPIDAQIGSVTHGHTAHPQDFLYWKNAAAPHGYDLQLITLFLN
ncbi:hypothetical protein PILCRDRAFT_401829 [Piloderma croceum F 1598]|uniref:Uncharacterized protein n=1 Tax=Piloderma croceum (strain F 1598) TaxID=765440 RepID=A0A0C3BCZ4_PILCF|nr:hypothetical protein PILCRDRAFT_401829 [Piloderma croceum F 1598]